MKIKLFKIISIVNFLFISGIFLQAQSEELRPSCKGVLGSSSVDISKLIVNPVSFSQALRILEGMNDSYGVASWNEGEIVREMNQLDQWLRSLIMNLYLDVGEQHLLLNMRSTDLKNHFSYRMGEIIDAVRAIHPLFLDYDLNGSLVSLKLSQWNLFAEGIRDKRRTEDLSKEIQEIKNMELVEEWFLTNSPLHDGYSFERSFKILEALRALDLPIKDANSWKKWIVEFILNLPLRRRKVKEELLVNKDVIDIEKDHFFLIVITAKELMGILSLIKEIDPVFAQTSIIGEKILQWSFLVSELVGKHSPKEFLTKLLEIGVLIGFGRIGSNSLEKEPTNYAVDVELIRQVVVGKKDDLNRLLVERVSSNFHRIFTSLSERERRNEKHGLFFLKDNMLSEAKKELKYTLRTLSAFNPINMGEVLEILKETGYYTEYESVYKGFNSEIDSRSRRWREVVVEWAQLLIYVSYYSNRKELIEISNELQGVHPDLFKILNSDFQEIVGNIVSMMKERPVSYEIVKVVEEVFRILKFSLPGNWSEIQKEVLAGSVESLDHLNTPLFKSVVISNGE